jgi:hypothetical protein
MVFGLLVVRRPLVVLGCPVSLVGRLVVWRAG